MQYGKQVTLQSFDKTGPGAYLLGKFPRKHNTCSLDSTLDKYYSEVSRG